MQTSCADWNKEKLVLNLTCLLWVSLEAGNGELCTWEATRQWCSYRKPVLTLWLGNIGGQLPLPETPREDAKLHLHRPQGSEELQTVNISMCTAVLVCMPWLNPAAGQVGFLVSFRVLVPQSHRWENLREHTTTPFLPTCTVFLPRMPWKRLMCAQVHAWHAVQIHSFKSAKDQDCKVLTRV